MDQYQFNDLLTELHLNHSLELTSFDVDYENGYVFVGFPSKNGVLTATCLLADVMPGDDFSKNELDFGSLFEFYDWYDNEILFKHYSPSFCLSLIIKECFRRDFVVLGKTGLAGLVDVLVQEWRRCGG